MKIIDLKPTEETPQIIFDIPNKNFEIFGNSMPENAPKFYQPLILWVKEISAKDITVIKLKIELEYINSSSAKQMLSLLNAFSSLQDKGIIIMVIWRCYEEDTLMIEEGEEFQELTGLSFEIQLFSD